MDDDGNRFADRVRVANQFADRVLCVLQRRREKSWENVRTQQNVRAYTKSPKCP